MDELSTIKKNLRILYNNECYQDTYYSYNDLDSILMDRNMSGIGGIFVFIAYSAFFLCVFTYMYISHYSKYPASSPRNINISNMIGAKVCLALACFF